MQLTRILGLILLSLASVALAAERQQIRTADYRLSINPRSPQQIGAFYEARGFPPKAVQQLQQQCYFTMTFHNISKAILLMDLADWKFTTPSGKLQRLNQAYWQRRWHEMKLAQRFRSTFRWTLAPERRDYRPDERAGGNLILPYTSAPIRIEAKIKRVDKQGEHSETIRMEGLRCAR